MSPIPHDLSNAHASDTFRDALLDPDFDADERAEWRGRWDAAAADDITWN